MGIGAGLYTYDVVVKTFTFAISSPDEFLVLIGWEIHETVCLTGLCLLIPL